MRLGAWQPSAPPALRKKVTCTKIPIRQGGYRFDTSWRLGREELWIRVQGHGNEVPLQRRSATRCVFGPTAFEGLELFLEALAPFELWSTATRKTVTCEVVVRSGGTPETVPVEVPTPVAPYIGELGAAHLEDLGGSEPTRYVGTGAAPFIGRMLHRPIAGMRFFKYGGLFTTDVNERGFDCISFTGSAFGAQSHMDRTGLELADHLGAAPVPEVPDNSVSGLVHNYFYNMGDRGTYLLWSGGHIVVVHGGSVHEFNVKPRNGYNVTRALDWLSAPAKRNTRFSLRRDPRVVDG